MKQLTLFFFLLFFSGFSFSQSSEKYDSIILLSIGDMSRENFPDDYESEEIGRAALSKREARKLDRKIHKKSSYGNNQAVTPAYDLKVLYYLDGNIEKKIEISLQTNNLFASMPLPVQRQGICMCEGNGGYCCSEGGISEKFKLFLLDLMEQHAIPVDREGIINMGK